MRSTRSIVNPPVPTTAAVVARLRAWRQASDVPTTHLADAAGLSEGAVRNMDRRDWNPTRETLEKLEALVPADFRPRAAA